MYCPTCKEHFDGKFCPECGTKLTEAPQTPELGVNFGSGFAVDGNINVTRTNTTNTYDQRVINTSNVTNIQERQKSDIELLQERKNRYFTACKRAFEDNVLDQDELIQLENYRVELGLSRDDADKLLDKIESFMDEAKQTIDEIFDDKDSDEYKEAMAEIEDSKIGKSGTVVYFGTAQGLKDVK
jgi:hypothetical protein